MGLEGVELVMALEEGFGVTITDAEAEASVTPAAVIDLIFGKLRASDERVCVSQRAFYLLRKGLARTLGVSRRSVALGADVRSFAVGRSERELWNDLKTTVQARSWPALARPSWLVASLWFLSLGGFCALLAVVPWYFAAACTGLVAWVAIRMTQSLRSRIPTRFSTIRTLVPFVVTSDAIAWTRDQVASLVKRTVVEQLGLREEHYREDAHFVKDLGMGR
jgi:acyl carrier protein